MTAPTEPHLSYHCEGDRVPGGWLGVGGQHAKAGDTATFSGYLGNGDQFDEAIADFSLAYWDQVQRDHTALNAAARKGSPARLYRHIIHD